VIVFKWMILVLSVFEMAGQTQPAVSIQVHPQVGGRSIRDGQVTTVYLARLSQTWVSFFSCSRLFIGG